MAPSPSFLQLQSLLLLPARAQFFPAAEISTAVVILPQAAPHPAQAAKALSMPAPAVAAAIKAVAAAMQAAVAAAMQAAVAGRMNMGSNAACRRCCTVLESGRWVEAFQAQQPWWSRYAWAAGFDAGSNPLASGANF